MAEFAFTVDIERPVSDVFAYMTDPSRLSEWQSDVLEAVPDGALAPGATVREVRRFLGRRMEFVQEVTEFEPDRRLAMRTRSGPFPLAATIDFEARGSATTVSFRAEANDPGRFFKLAEPVVVRVAERQVRNQFQTAKDILEASSGVDVEAPAGRS